MRWVVVEAVILSNCVTNPRFKNRGLTCEKEVLVLYRI